MDVDLTVYSLRYQADAKREEDECARQEAGVQFGDGHHGSAASTKIKIKTPLAYQLTLKSDLSEILLLINADPDD